MIEIFLVNGKNIQVEETYEDVSIEIYEAKMDKYPFIRLTIIEKVFDQKQYKAVDKEIEIQININNIVWFK